MDSDNGQKVPLIERLGRVPATARVIEQTPNPLGFDVASFPVGALCREAAARIAALEAELERERIRLAACGVVAGANTRDSAAKVRQMSPEYRSASLDAVERAVDREIAERERREAAEALLRGVRTSTIDQLDFEIAPLIDAHFARYKDCTGKNDMTNDHDKILCERLATSIDHGICKCAERSRIAALEAELAAERERRKAAEALLHDYSRLANAAMFDANRSGYEYDRKGEMVGISAHFARYKD